MDIEISPNEVIAEMQQRFPKELEICLQSVQIKKMGELLEVSPVDEPQLEVVEDAEVPPGPGQSGEAKVRPEKASDR
jgi:hypothetical protein